MMEEKKKAMTAAERQRKCRLKRQFNIESGGIGPNDFATPVQVISTISASVKESLDKFTAVTGVEKSRLVEMAVAEYIKNHLDEYTDDKFADKRSAVEAKSSYPLEGGCYVRGLDPHKDAYLFEFQD